MTSKLELPEIETMRRDLEREFATRKIKGINIQSLKSFKSHKTKKDIEARVLGVKIETVERYGMHLALRLDNTYLLVITVGPNGSFVKASKKTTKEVMLSIQFTQGGSLDLLDDSGESVFHLVENEELLDVVLDPENPSALDLQAEPLSWVEFGRIVMAYDVPLKLFLTDPAIFVGIGDIYSNEILFDAGLKYDRISNKLSTQEIRRLYRSVANTIHEAIKHGGTSLEDRPFLNILGEPGEYAAQLSVYGKNGELSPRSRLPIKKTKFKHQVVYYCDTQV